MNCADKIARQYKKFIVTKEQFQQITDDLNRPSTKEELEFWYNAIKEGKKIDKR